MIFREHVFGFFFFRFITFHNVEMLHGLSFLRWTSPVWVEKENDTGKLVEGLLESYKKNKGYKGNDDIIESWQSMYHRVLILCLKMLIVPVDTRLTVRDSIYFETWLNLLYNRVDFYHSRVWYIFSFFFSLKSKIFFPLFSVFLFFFFVVVVVVTCCSSNLCSCNIFFLMLGEEHIDGV